MIEELKPYSDKFVVESEAEGILEVCLPRQSGATNAIISFCKDHPEYKTCIFYPSGSMKSFHSSSGSTSTNPVFATLEDDEFFSYCKIADEKFDYAFFDCCKFSTSSKTIEYVMSTVPSKRYVIVDTGYTHKYKHPSA